MGHQRSFVLKKEMAVDATSVTDFESSLMDFPELASEFLISLWPSVTFRGVVSVVQCLEGDV